MCRYKNQNDIGLLSHNKMQNDNELIPLKCLEVISNPEFFFIVKLKLR